MQMIIMLLLKNAFFLFSIAQELLVTDRHLIQAHMVVIKINKINEQLGGDTAL